MNFLKNIVAGVEPLLKTSGYNRTGTTFRHEFHGNFSVINFQKSRDSKQDFSKFTINLGIFLNILKNLDSFDDRILKPKVEECHWTARIGQFMPNSLDYWWDVGPRDDLVAITLDIANVVQLIALPELHRRFSEDALLKSWLDDDYAGTTVIGKFKYIITILKLRGETSILYEYIENFMQKFKGRPNAIRAKEYLDEIGYVN